MWSKLSGHKAHILSQLWCLSHPLKTLKSLTAAVITVTRLWSFARSWMFNLIRGNQQKEQLPYAWWKTVNAMFLDAFQFYSANHYICIPFYELGCLLEKVPVALPCSITAWHFNDIYSSSLKLLISKKKLTDTNDFYLCLQRNKTAR